MLKKIQPHNYRMAFIAFAVIQVKKKKFWGCSWLQASYKQKQDAIALKKRKATLGYNTQSGTAKREKCLTAFVLL